MLKPKNIPTSPGVYQFSDKNGEVLYVGKAKNLKNRVSSYFSNDLLPKTAQMVSSSHFVKFIKVGSEFEALLLEANLIKKYKPKYNIQLKDDKTPLYVVITNEKYTRILMVRKTDMSSSKFKIKYFFGPYLSSKALKQVLGRLRKVFPFATHEPGRKICIYRQIGLCNPCPSEIEGCKDTKIQKELRKSYLRNVRGVKNILSGKFEIVQKDLEKEIKEYSKEEKFEEAENILKQSNLFKDLLETSHVDIDEYLENPNLIEDVRDQELKELAKIVGLTSLKRIECFDIAHFAGSFPTASMVTFIDGEPSKKDYRHFKIYQKNKQSDVDSMREVITRRLKHLEDWGKPDLIVIDGGKPQLSSVYDLLNNQRIAFIGLAKRFETIVIHELDGSYKEIRATGTSLRLLQRIRDEAHRFARRLHHKEVYNGIVNK